MKITRARLGFCASVAAIAGALTDPLIEAASNAGWFGTATFTDRSNLDVVPALSIGLALLGLFLVRKARLVLVAPGVLGRARDLVPVAFALQIGLLYVMETAEQYATAGHALGPAVWLGGPALVSLVAHAFVCAGVTSALVRFRRPLAQTALRALAFVAAILSGGVDASILLATNFAARVSTKARLPRLGAIGERAPPAAA